MKDEYLALTVGQSIERLLESRLQKAVSQSRAHGDGIRHRGLTRPAGLGLPERLESRIDGDSMQPRGETGVAAERRERTNGSNPRLLGVVLSEVVASRDSSDHRVDPRCVPFVELANRLGVPGARSSNDLCFPHPSSPPVEIQVFGCDVPTPANGCPVGRRRRARCRTTPPKIASGLEVRPRSPGSLPRWPGVESFGAVNPLDPGRPAPAQSTTPRRPGPGAGTLIGIGAILLFLVGRVLLAPLGIPGVGIAQWLFLALPIVVALQLGGFDPASSLGLRPVGTRVLTGAGLVMFGALGLNSVVAWLQSFWVEVPIELVEALNEALRPSGPLEMVTILMAVAVTPAVCEELVFRGVVLQSWHRWPPALAIGLNALLFGAIHWMPGSAFRVLPAAVSGGFIAWAVWRTRSIWTGVWMHLLNNGFLVLAAMVLTTMEDVPAAQAVNGVGDEAPHPLAVGLFVLLIVVGARLMGSAGDRSTPGEERSE